MQVEREPCLFVVQVSLEHRVGLDLDRFDIHKGVQSRAQFFEPGGLSVSANTLYVADTNNHAIRVIDVSTRDVRTLRFEGLAPPATWSYLKS